MYYVRIRKRREVAVWPWGTYALPEVSPRERSLRQGSTQTPAWYHAHTIATYEDDYCTSFANHQTRLIVSTVPANKIADKKVECYFRVNYIILKIHKHYQLAELVL